MIAKSKSSAGATCGHTPPQSGATTPPAGGVPAVGAGHQFRGGFRPAYRGAGNQAADACGCRDSSGCISPQSAATAPARARSRHLSACGGAWPPRLFWVQEVAGSSPATPTRFQSEPLVGGDKPIPPLSQLTAWARASAVFSKGAQP